MLVTDEDEPPAFVNEPRPYLATVPFTTPIGLAVYQLMAKDEMGDSTSQAPITYRIVNQEPGITSDEA